MGVGTRFQSLARAAGRLAPLAMICAVLAVAAFPVEAQARRLALVVGNDAYEKLPRLQKAVGDARSVGATLANLGYSVIKGENVSRREMNRLFADFEQQVQPGDTTFFFFAGHGVSIGAENFLLPTDMPRPRENEAGLVQDEAHSVNALIQRIQSRHAAANIFILDACRDNPFAATGVRSIGGTRGLGRTDAPTGVFVLYSAGIGQSALDRLSDSDADPNSVFTRKLIPLLQTPGLTHVQLAKRLQSQVSSLAGSIAHAQQPAYYDQIIGEIAIGPSGPAPTNVTPPQVQEAAPQAQPQTALLQRPSAPPKPVLRAAYDAWGAYEVMLSGAKTCYIVSKAVSASPTSINHGTIFFIVNKKAKGFEPQLEATQYLDERKPLVVSISGKKVNLLAQQNSAWVYSEAQTNLLMGLMKQGSTMAIDGNYADGGKFRYEFKLNGMTASLDNLSDCR